MVSALICALILGLAGSFLAVGRTMLDAYVSQGLPEEALVVEAGTTELGPLEVADELPSDLRDRLKNDPNVADVFSEESLGVPSHISGNLFGHSYGIDASIVGIEPEALKWLAPHIDPEAFTSDEPISGIAPGMLLTAYNASFGPANNLPRLTPQAIVGRKFNMIVGASSLRRAEKTEQKRVTLAGFTTRADLLSLFIPLEVVTRLNESFGISNPQRRLIVFAACPDAAVALADSLRRDGLRVSGGIDRLRTLARIDFGIFLLSLGLGFSFVLLASLTFHFGAEAHCRAHSEEIELLHELGVSRREIISRFASRFIRHGFAGIGAGLVLSALSGGAALALIQHFLPGLPAAKGLSIPFLLGLLLSLAPGAGIIVGARLGTGRIARRWTERRPQPER